MHHAMPMMQMTYRNAQIMVLLVTVMISVITATAQPEKKRLQPGKLYESGEVIYAPFYGFSSTVPANWKGTLPIDMEIFLLLPDTTGICGEIYTFASEKNDLSSLQKHWLRGVSFSPSIKVRATDITLENDMIMAEVVPEGDAVNTGNKGFAMARCGPFGYCITCLAIGPVQCYDEMKMAVENFMRKALFTQPSDVSIYVDFNWKEFLSNKSLITFSMIEQSSGSGSKENTFNLCGDGTFNGQIKKKGSMKQLNASYKGYQSGSWSTESIGETGVLKLAFKKLPAAELQMSIKDDRIYVNGERYFVAESAKCKQ
ncbi:hypothetical protein [Chryseosolibacter histidini]|nr:hypothetical protein [Chryseosolibacter histidini]